MLSVVGDFNVEAGGVFGIVTGDRALTKSRYLLPSDQMARSESSEEAKATSPNRETSP